MTGDLFQRKTFLVGQWCGTGHPIDWGAQFLIQRSFINLLYLFYRPRFLEQETHDLLQIQLGIGPSQKSTIVIIDTVLQTGGVVNPHVVGFPLKVPKNSLSKKEGRLEQ